MASITTLYPDHVVLVSRRSSSIAGVNYSLIAFRERGAAAAVRIDGAANLDSKAWVFDLACPANRAMDGLLTLLEQIADLKNLPAAAAGP
jgi:acetolactate synthase regulatory subunit